MGCGYSVYSEKDDVIFKHTKAPAPGIRKVVKMFKKENGLLFRLELQGGEWAFYNDTDEYEFHVRYVFNGDSDIDALDDATLSEMDDGTVVVELIVYPRETAMFVKGDITGAQGRVEAQPVSERYKREKIKRKVLAKGG
ncbi:small myristoylated protein-1 [Trypanosoma theileri]|uniref:Small myristoylated protein-1 n=1 Tax=Trypanosoma theileri TaxID=67003 RepID=A0A1X0NYV3_9TRYP|nr:small myristoylated protein-1 [Trypanosoma theileri]ORC89643.1 small myristoylated protein-1 [Trypanosoma theileri]